MRILVISNLFPPEFVGGAEILCEQVCRALASRGHFVHVVTSGPPVDAGRADVRVVRSLRLTRSFGTPAVEITRLDRWRTWRHNYAAVRRAIEQVQPDVVFAWSPRRLSIAGAHAAQDAGVPVAYSFNDDAIAAYVPARRSWSARAIARRVVGPVLLQGGSLDGLRLTHATAISCHLKGHLEKAGVDTSGTRVIYQAIEVDSFPPKAVPGTLHSPLRVVSLSSLLPEKGVHTIVEAAHATAAHFPVQLTIVGDGLAWYEADLRRLAAGGPAVVTFRGRIPHDMVGAELRAHDVLVFGSSAREAFGLTQIEAMASGTTVVSTRDGGHAEMLRDGENALLFPYEDAGALSRCLLRLQHDHALSRRLAGGARAHVARQFSFDRYLAQLEALLFDTIGKTHALRPTA